MTTTGVEADVWRAVASVDDPEYPGISISDMGMVESCRVEDGHAHIVLVPTFTGCPALDFIESDVRDAVGSVTGVELVSVEFDQATVWDTVRLSATARRRMAEDYTVAVALPSRPTPCPRCRREALVETSMFGPIRCRAIHRCRNCGEAIEVMRA
jgi:ring-1,2-phenylacetyl-CoA epoxidase subunit PaaD